MFFFFTDSGDAVSRVTPMDGVIASAQFDLDATSTDSWGGSGTWNSLINASDYPLQLGTSSGSDTADPTFNGTVDDKDAYWSFDGGDVFRQLTNTAFLNNLHKTTGGTPWWIAMPLFIPSALTGAEVRWFNTKVTGRGIYLTMQLQSAANPAVVLYQEGDTAEVNYASNTSGVNLTRNAENIVIVSSDGSSLKMWINSDTANVDTTLAFNATATNPEYNLTLANNIFNSRGMPAGMRLYGVSAGNELLTDAKAKAINDEYKKRYSARSFV